MAEKSGFFNSNNGDRKYYVSFFAEYFSSFVGNGVFWGGNYLKVEPVGGNMDITVAPGKAWINGYYYNNETTAKTLTIPGADLTRSRIDAIVLRLDLRDESRFIEAVVKQGEASNNPVCPELQRDDAIWELKLAEIRVNANVSIITASNITDYRLNSNACGIVQNFVPNGFTYDEIFNQYTSELQKRMNEWDNTKTSQENSWNTQMSNQQLEFNKKMSEIEQWYVTVKADIKALQNFDFDNTSELKGATKDTIPKEDGSILEEIYITVSGKKVAERYTEFPADDTVKVYCKVYDDDELILKSSTTTTYFNEDGTIREVIE